MKKIFVIWVAGQGCCKGKKSIFIKRSPFFVAKMLNNIKPDKWRHFYVGIAMGLLFEGVLLRYFSASVLMGSIISLFLVVVISYGFELTSLVFKRGHYDVADAVASIVGGIAGMAIILLLLEVKIG